MVSTVFGSRTSAATASTTAPRDSISRRAAGSSRPDRLTSDSDETRPDRTAARANAKPNPPVPPVTKHRGASGERDGSETVTETRAGAGTRRATLARPSASTETKLATSRVVAGRQLGGDAFESSTSRSTTPPNARGRSSCTPRANATSAATIGRRLAPVERNAYTLPDGSSAATASRRIGRSAAVAAATVSGASSSARVSSTARRAMASRFTSKPGTALKFACAYTSFNTARPEASYASHRFQ